MRAVLLAALLALLPLLPQGAAAQGTATLVADSVSVPAGGDSLIAQGNVQVFYDGTTLTAQRITFDRTTDQLRIDGPILVTDGDGTVFTADQATLDPQLENGILRSARLVLDQQLQMAANQIDRVDGRYTQLYSVAATSCHICAEGETPLWEIRARRVIHDEAERQLYFDDATFRVYGLPIAYIPRMRLPDPTLRRATGLLIPSLRTTGDLGTGIKLPYFIRLGDHRDLTLTPYLSSSTTTLEADYRQVFRRGDLTFKGAVSRDDLSDDLRGYAFADGIFDLGRDIILRFDVEYATDDIYLLEYGYSDKDRLDSEVSLERVRDRDLTRAALTYYSSQRASEVSETLPPVLSDVSWERRLTPDRGGTLTLTSDIEAHDREATAINPLSGDVVEDAARVGFGAAWRTDRVLTSGVVIEASTGFDVDYYNVSDTATAADTWRATTFAQTTLRYPLIRRGASATHVIEPMVQLAWSDVAGDPVTNEDSLATEFDQANLLALSRFSGEDAVEEGLRGAAGVTWTRVGTQGWDSTLTVGRVIRAEPEPNFSATSGLGTPRSDWLVAGQVRVPSGLGIDSRLIFGDDFSVTKSETRAEWSGARVDLSASYIFLPADAAESRPSSVAEVFIDSAVRLNPAWTVGFETRFDVTENEPTEAGLELGWQNECVNVDFSVSRRFTSSTTLSPSTDFGLSIGLGGFSAGRTFDPPVHRCSN